MGTNRCTHFECRNFLNMSSQESDSAVTAKNIILPYSRNTFMNLGNELKILKQR